MYVRALFASCLGYALLIHRLTWAATKVGAIVSGQTSVKAPEKAAFEKYLPADVHIVSCHSLHGPTVSTEGQPLVRAVPSSRPLFMHMNFMNYSR